VPALTSIRSLLMSTVGPVALLSSRSAKEMQPNRAKRYACYCQVLALHHQGRSHKKIATTLRISPITVRTFSRAGTFPERATYRRRSQLDPYVAFVHQRWAAGGKNPTQLWRAIVAQGYQGTPRMVRRYVERLGQRLKPLPPEQRPQVLQAETTFKTPSVRQAAYWLLKPSQERTAEQEAFITQLCMLSPEIKEVHALAPDRPASLCSPMLAATRARGAPPRGNIARPYLLPLLIGVHGEAGRAATPLIVATARDR
jgi:hypothetical protein